MAIRFLNYTFVSFFSWKQISVIIRNIYYGQIMSYYGNSFLKNIC